MATSLIITLASATILAVGASSLARLPSATTTQLPEPSLDNTNSSEENETSGIAVTNYYYMDYPKIGYMIFKRKMLEAFQLFDRYMSMKPAIVKVTSYFLNSNDSCIICSEMPGNDTGSEESTDESAPQALPSTRLVSEIEPQPDPVSEKERDEVKQTKVEPEGFFSKSFAAVGGLFNTISSWFG